MHSGFAIMLQHANHVFYTSRTDEMYDTEMDKDQEPEPDMAAHLFAPPSAKRGRLATADIGRARERPDETNVEDMVLPHKSTSPDKASKVNSQGRRSHTLPEESQAL